MRREVNGGETNVMMKINLSSIQSHEKSGFAGKLNENQELFKMRGNVKVIYNA